MTHCSRKRPRSCDEECCELMPISKRINDLHIRSGCPDSNNSLNNLQEINSRLHNSQDMNMCNLHSHSMEAKNNGMPCNYNPALSAIENPYYYHSNEILYAAHMQRMQRAVKPLGQ